MVTKAQLEQAMDQRFSKEVYEKFSRAKVCIAGLGGLGSNIAVMLARSGIGTLKLIDFDQVDITNLNRQAYRIEHIGMSKTKALREMIGEINPYIQVEAIQIKVIADAVLITLEVGHIHWIKTHQRSPQANIGFG